MADKKNTSSNSENDENEPQEPVVNDPSTGSGQASGKPDRRIDPETGDVRKPKVGGGAGSKESAPHPADADSASVEAADDLTGDDQADDRKVDDLTDADQALLDGAAVDLVAEMRSDMLRAQAELVNFRTRVERDRTANREAVIAEVIRSLLPALDDLDRARAHGDLEEGTPMAIVAQKLHSGFERYGLRTIGEKGDVFDPAFHEAVVQIPSPDVTVNTVADVLETGYALGERLVRPAKVAVSVPAE